MPMMVGMPSSRQMMAACEVTPPCSVSTPAAARKNRTRSGSVDSLTTIVPFSKAEPQSSARMRTLQGPAALPREATTPRSTLVSRPACDCGLTSRRSSAACAPVKIRSCPSTATNTHPSRRLWIAEFLMRRAFSEVGLLRAAYSERSIR